MKLKKILAFCVLLSCITALPGCDLAKWLAYVAGLEKKVRIEAEFPYLEKQKVAVIIQYPDNDIYYNHKNFKQSLGLRIESELSNKVDGIKIYRDALFIKKFDKENPNWQNDKTLGELAAELKVDYLVVVDISNYTTLHENVNRQYQVDIEANIEIYSPAEKTEEYKDYCVWRSDEPVKVKYPRDIGSPITSHGSKMLIIESGERIFAQEVVKKFYDRTESVKTKPDKYFDDKTGYSGH